MKSWHDFLDKQRNAKREVQIGLVGKYDLQDAYKSIRESLNLAAIYNDAKARIHFINSEEITQANVADKLAFGGAIRLVAGVSIFQYNNLAYLALEKTLDVLCHKQGRRHKMVGHHRLIEKK